MNIENFQEKLNNYTESMTKTHISFKNHPTEDKGVTSILIKGGIKWSDRAVLTGISNPIWFPHVIDADYKARGVCHGTHQGSGDMNLL